MDDTRLREPGVPRHGSRPFGRAGFYTKLEKSCAKDADYFLTVEMGGDLTNPLAIAGEV